MNTFKFLKIKKLSNTIILLKKIYLKKNFLYSISNAKYLIRLDDACNTYSFEKWKKLEDIFDKLNIKPIVAVIPFNKDESLMLDESKNNFWDIVKKWENKGWGIAVHGHSHLYHEVNKNKLILPFYNRSEFGGLSLKKQRDLIKESYNFFLKKGLNPKIWIAPSHTFDKNTLVALKRETNIKVISDGLSIFPFRYKQITFIPQQLWGFKKKFFGIWTICIHPNTMNQDDIFNLENSINDKFFYERIIDFEAALKYEQELSILSRIYKQKFWFIKFIKNSLKHLIRKIL